MFKDIFTDIWLNYRGRFLCSLTGHRLSVSDRRLLADPVPDAVCRRRFLYRL